MKRYFISILLLFAALALVDCSRRLGAVAAADKEGEKEAEREKESAEPIPVQAAAVQTASFERRVRVHGLVRPLPGGLALASATIEGVVAEVLVAEGDPVKARQPLARLDDRLARHELAQAKLARSELEASLALLKAPPREPDRRAAELEVEHSRISVALARAVLDRLIPLHERKEVSEPQLFEARQKLEESSLALRSAEARRDILVQGPRPEAVAEAEARLGKARSAVELAETRLALLTLEAPAAGLVNKINCRLGQMLAAGAAAVEIADASRILVTAAAPPGDAASIRPGQEARVFAGGIPPAGERTTPPLAGKVVFVGLEVSGATGAALVNLSLENTQGRLRLGETVSAEIVLAKIDAVLAVPEAALVPTDEGPSLVVIRGGKSALLHPKVGLEDGERGLVEVSAEGLRAGDLVITTGGYNLPEGTKVKVEASPPPAEKIPPESSPPEKAAPEKQPGEAEAPGPKEAPKK